MTDRIEKEQAMSITEQDIKSLTPEHRIIWKEPGAPREVEMGLWEDEGGHLYTDAGAGVRWGDGTVYTSALNSIVRIIEPAFVPRRGLVIGEDLDWADDDLWLVCFEPDRWGGPAGLIVGVGLFNDDEARDLIENHGWKVVDDLTEGGKQ